MYYVELRREFQPVYNITVNEGGILNLPGNGKSDSFLGESPATPEQQKNYIDWWEALLTAGITLGAAAVGITGWKAVIKTSGNKGKDPNVIETNNIFK